MEIYTERDQTIDSDELCTNVITFYPRHQSKRSHSGMFFLNLSSRRRVLKGAHAFSAWEKARKATKIDNSWQSSWQKGIHARRSIIECISRHERTNAPFHLLCYPSGTVTLSAPNPLTSHNTHIHTLPLCLRNLCEMEDERNRRKAKESLKEIERERFTNKELRESENDL